MDDMLFNDRILGHEGDSVFFDEVRSLVEGGRSRGGSTRDQFIVKSSGCRSRGSHGWLVVLGKRKVFKDGWGSMQARREVPASVRGMEKRATSRRDLNAWKLFWMWISDAIAFQWESW